MNHFLRTAFFLCVVRPVVLVVLGLNVRHRERLPKSGPAILVANHNSHLDTMVLMTLFRPRMLRLLRPVAAEDYFLGGRFRAWFSTQIIGIIPIPRQVEGFHQDPIAGIDAALAAGEIVILYPEGSRGQSAEELQEFKTGIAHIARRHREVPIYPIYLHGLGKALPKGSRVPVPFFCDVFAGEPLTWQSAGRQRDAFMTALDTRMHALAAEGNFPKWE